MKTGTALAIVIPLVAAGGVAIYLVTRKDESGDVGVTSQGLSAAGGGGGGGGGMLDVVLGGGTAGAVGIVAGAAGDVVAQHGGRMITAVGKEAKNTLQPLKSFVGSDAFKFAAKNLATGGGYTLYKAGGAVVGGATSATKKVYHKVKGWF